MAVQKLFEACKAAFTGNGGAFSDQPLLNVRSLLDNIKPSDVGLDEDRPRQHNRIGDIFGKVDGRMGKLFPLISYLHIYECKDFSIGIFCLPASAVIPLHNHPGMMVMSKLLYGSMHVKAYDWVNHSDESNPRLAKLVVDRVMSSPCESTVLYPKSGGNMHVFTAVTSCAVLDVLAPPYSARDGRHCSYYKASPYARYAGPHSEELRQGIPPENLVWLEEVKPPADFAVKCAAYTGPQIIS